MVPIVLAPLRGYGVENLMNWDWIERDPLLE
jgi:hypothetical protein